MNLNISHSKLTSTASWLLRIVIASLAVSLFCCGYSFVIEKINVFVGNKAFFLLFLPLGCYLVQMVKSFVSDEAHKQVISTWISHFSGASVGKEGVGITLGRKIASYFFTPKCDSLFYCDMSSVIGSIAAFAALFVSPFAPVMFAFETSRAKEAKFSDVMVAILSSLVSFTFAKFMGFSPFRVVGIESDGFSLRVFLILIVALFLTLGAVMSYKSFLAYLRETSKNRGVSFQQFLSFSMLIISLIVFSIVQNRYVNSLSVQIFSFVNESTALGIILTYLVAKIVLSTMSIVAGFTGGEFVPLVVIGVCAGAVMCNIFEIHSPLIMTICGLGALVFGMKIPFTALMLIAEFLCLGAIGT